MKHRARGRGWTLGALVLGLVAAVGTWGLVDTRTPDDRAFRNEDPGTTSLPLSTFQAVSEITSGLEEIAKDNAALRHALRQGTSRSRDEIKHVLTLDAISSLPSKLEAILAVRKLQVSGERGLDRHGDFEQRTLPIARLLAAIARIQFDQNREEAWRFGLLSVQLCRLLHEEASKLPEFVAAHACLTIAVSELARGIRDGGWTENQLEELVALPQSSPEATRFAAAIKDDYRRLFTAGGKMSAERSFPYKQFSYHPNATKQQWIAAVQSMFERLAAGNAASAFREFQKGSAELEYPWLGRNELGYRLLTSALPQYSSPLEQFVTSTLKIPLLRIQAAVELYRRIHSRPPSRLSELVPEMLTEIPQDAWDLTRREFRYVPGANRVYSVGPNAIDDGGRYEKSFEYDQHTDDYGIRFQQ